MPESEEWKRMPVVAACSNEVARLRRRGHGSGFDGCGLKKHFLYPEICFFMYKKVAEAPGPGRVR